jgi:hypothetical protein
MMIIQPLLKLDKQKQAQGRKAAHPVGYDGLLAMSQQHLWSP